MIYVNTKTSLTNMVESRGIGCHRNEQASRFEWKWPSCQYTAPVKRKGSMGQGCSILCTFPLPEVINPQKWAESKVEIGQLAACSSCWGLIARGFLNGIVRSENQHTTTVLTALGENVRSLNWLETRSAWDQPENKTITAWPIHLRLIFGKF